MPIMQHFRMLSCYSLSAARLISPAARLQQTTKCRAMASSTVGVARSLQQQRNFSVSSMAASHAGAPAQEPSRLAVKHEEEDLKKDAVNIFKYAIKAVHPRQMIEGVLGYNRSTSVLRVQEEKYHLQRNVFVVGMGSAVLGMARVVEDVLGDHVVTGVISIPKGLQEEMRRSNDSDMVLSPRSKIMVYEGADNNEVDEASHNASKAILSLVSKLTEKDLLIVLCSGGGSTLCPSPPPSISLEDLHTITRLLNHNGASIQDLNTIRKNIEVLKGGGLAAEAKPAKVITLILSSIIGDPVDLIASGPTYNTQPTPSHCLEILKRLNVLSQTPESVRKYLEKAAKLENLAMREKQVSTISKQQKKDWKSGLGVQNIVVGNNSIACQAVAEKADELGYRPVIMTTSLTGEARDVGKLYAKLAEFIMMCFDRKVAQQPSVEMASLELELVAGGLMKGAINHIGDEVDAAHNTNRDICIIASGETVVHVTGSGRGGKNQETALGAAVQLKREFRDQEPEISETPMCFLSGDSDGYDGICPAAGAVVDLELVDRAKEVGVSMEEFLENNDSYNFFTMVNDGKNLVYTNITGTNVMDIVILLVRKPTTKKYKWT